MSGGFGGRSGGGSSSRGRGRGRGSGYQGNNYQARGGGHTRSAPDGPPARLRPCSEYTTTGSCRRGDSCHFSHVVKLHASIDATSPMPSNNNNRYNQSNVAKVSSVAIWETQGAIKIFTGSQDGFWRLWNTQTFVKEFEHQIGNVECVKVASNFLFCGFEGVSVALPSVKVGMIHSWNLARPTDPPLEFHMQTPLLPYAHNSRVTTLTVEGDKTVSGSLDGSIRLWSFDAVTNGFLLQQSLCGHAAEVTGLQVVENLLWSSSTDRSIRVWDLSKNGECLFLINKEKQGHDDAVTGLLKFESPAGPFVLSSSLDGTIKAWNGTNGNCVASESHGDGVVCMALVADQKANPVLLVGLENGKIMARNVLQTPKAPAFCLLFSLSARFTAGHEGAVTCICGGPQSTFYSGGSDGKLLVWQITGDLGI